MWEMGGKPLMLRLSKVITSCAPNSIFFSRAQRDPVVNPPPLFRTPLSLISGSTVQIFAGLGVFGGVNLFETCVPFVCRVGGGQA